MRSWAVPLLRRLLPGAAIVASVIEVMNRVATSSSSGVNSAIAAAMWRASGMNMAPPSR